MSSEVAARRKPGKDPHSPYSWEIVPDTLEIARKRIGLKRYVRVAHRSLVYMRGHYEGLNQLGEHVIVIAADLRSDYASRAVWHELWHALQLEKMGSAQFNRVYNEQLLASGARWKEVRKGSEPALRAYRAMPLEREAFAAEELDNELRLCQNKNQ